MFDTSIGTSQQNAADGKIFRIVSAWREAIVCDYCVTFQQGPYGLELRHAFRLGGLFTGEIDEPVGLFPRYSLEAPGKPALVILDQSDVREIREVPIQPWMKTTAAEVERLSLKKAAARREPARLHYTTGGVVWERPLSVVAPSIAQLQFLAELERYDEVLCELGRRGGKSLAQIITIAWGAIRDSEQEQIGTRLLELEAPLDVPA